MVKKKNKKKRREKNFQQKIFLGLMIIVLLLSMLNVVKAKGWLIPEQKEVEIIDNTIILDSMSLEQKIAQMVIAHGAGYNREALQNMQLGGIHLFAMKDSGLFKTFINKFQRGMQIPFFVTADLEGCLNPFSNFHKSKAVSEIVSKGEAFNKGSDDGKFLKNLGFSINFAPVVDLDDQIWKCRSFPGDEEQIAHLAEAYIQGLQQEGVLATAKHYPGKTLVVKDPHKSLVTAVIDVKDMFPYKYLKNKNRSNNFMVSHIIVSGDVDSKGAPSVVSSDIITPLKEGSGGLIISDDIMMLGLRNFYDSPEEMYVAVFKAGNDLILNFNDDPNKIYYMIQIVKEAVEKGIIDEAQIDNSVRKILNAKGFIVIR